MTEQPTSARVPRFRGGWRSLGGDFAFFVAAQILFTALFALGAEKKPVGVCTGEDPCKVCHDCSKCRYCSPKNPQHGSCGVIRDQDAAAARRRMEKQAGGR